MKKWAAEFRRGKKTLENDPWSGGPATAITKENIDRLQHIVMDDWRLPTNQRANVINIYYDRVDNILQNELGMTKVSSCWMQRLLTPDPV